MSQGVRESLTLRLAQTAGFGEALLLPLSSRHSSNLTSQRLAAELFVGAALGACTRYSAMKHSSARYQYDVWESPINLRDTNGSHIQDACMWRSCTYLEPTKQQGAKTKRTRVCGL